MLFAIEIFLEMTILFPMHIVINFYDNHIKTYGWILGKEWTNNKLLKWWHSNYHAKKSFKCELKKCCNNVKLK